MLLELRGDEQG